MVGVNSTVGSSDTNFDQCNVADNIIDDSLKDILQESIGMGLGKAAKVIGELVDSHVHLSAAKVYLTESFKDLPFFSERIIVQEMEGGSLAGKTVFSMADEELLKLIKYLEDIDELFDTDEQVLEMILDTYQEIGNIILGNTISSIVDFLQIRVDIKVPYLADIKTIAQIESEKLLVVDVLFKINKINANGKLCLVYNYSTYKSMAEIARSMYN